MRTFFGPRIYSYQRKYVFSRILLSYIISGVLINFNSHISTMGIMRAAMIGHVAGRSARRQMEGMQKQAQAQQAQAQAQAQAAQAQAQAAQQAQQAQRLYVKTERSHQAQ